MHKPKDNLIYILLFYAPFSVSNFFFFRKILSYSLIAHFIANHVYKTINKILYIPSSTYLNSNYRKSVNIYTMNKLVKSVISHLAIHVYVICTAWQFFYFCFWFRPMYFTVKIQAWSSQGRTVNLQLHTVCYKHIKISLNAHILYLQQASQMRKIFYLMEE